MALTNNKAVLNWIDEMAAMTQPDQIVWIDGSDAQIEDLRAQACASFIYPEIRVRNRFSTG